MKLWMILSLEEYEQLQREGVYGTCGNQDRKYEDLTLFTHAIEWLNGEMTRRVGPAPGGVVCPLHGWLRWETGRVRPDLRWMRWNWGPDGEHVLLQIDVPEDQVIFIDGECWSMIRNKWLITDNEEEFNRLYEVYDALSPEEKEKMLRDNWLRAFDIEYVGDNDWRDKGYEVEAIIWELRKEQVLSAKKFVSKLSKLYR